MFRFSNMVVLKITKDCNLRCEYCYVKNKDNYKGQVIDFEVYKKIIDKIIEDKIVQKEEDKNFQLVFHGGEPLIVPDKDLVKMLEYAHHNFKKNKINFGFSMQSNLTLLTEEKISILSKYNVSVGASFDGIDDNNLKRTDKKSSFFEKKFNTLKENNISHGTLIVAGEDNTKNIYKSYSYLKDKLGQDFTDGLYINSTFLNMDGNLL